MLRVICLKKNTTICCFTIKALTVYSRFFNSIFYLFLLEIKTLNLMKNLAVCFVFFLFKTRYSQVKKIPAETTVQNVTIFSSGARVERKSTVSIMPGRSEITFSGLSNQLDQKSVQLNADADITLLSVQATKDFLNERKIDNEENNFIEKTKSLKDKLDLDTKMLEVFKNEEEMLKKNEAIGGTSGVKTTELKEALDLHRQRLTEVYEKQLEIQNRITEEQKNLSRFSGPTATNQQKKRQH